MHMRKASQFIPLVSGRSRSVKDLELGWTDGAIELEWVLRVRNIWDGGSLGFGLLYHPVGSMLGRANHVPPQTLPSQCPDCTGPSGTPLHLPLGAGSGLDFAFVWPGEP